MLPGAVLVAWVGVFVGLLWTWARTPAPPRLLAVERTDGGAEAWAVRRACARSGGLLLAEPDGIWRLCPELGELVRFDLPAGVIRPGWPLEGAPTAIEGILPRAGGALTLALAEGVGLALVAASGSGGAERLAALPVAPGALRGIAGDGAVLELITAACRGLQFTQGSGTREVRVQRCQRPPESPQRTVEWATPDGNGWHVAWSEPAPGGRRVVRDGVGLALLQPDELVERIAGNVPSPRPATHEIDGARLVRLVPGDGWRVAAGPAVYARDGVRLTPQRRFERDGVLSVGEGDGAAVLMWGPDGAVLQLDGEPVARRWRPAAPVVVAGAGGSRWLVDEEGRYAAVGPDGRRSDGAGLLGRLWNVLAAAGVPPGEAALSPRVALAFGLVGGLWVLLLAGLFRVAGVGRAAGQVACAVWLGIAAWLAGPFLTALAML